MKNGKAVIAGLAVVLFLALGSANCVYATGTFTDIFMTDSNGSTTPKSTFGFNETPWLYLNLPATGFNASASFWNDPDGNEFFVGGLSGNKQYWFSLNTGRDSNDLPVSWASVKKAGDWNVDASYFFANNPKDPAGIGSANFKVLPEPVATILFITGGTMLLARRMTRKKKA